MPTFQLYKDGMKIGEVRGAHIQKVEDMIKANISEEPNYGMIGFVNLKPVIAMSGVGCLNHKSVTNPSKLFERDSSFIESDCDEQLLIKIPFTHPVKLKALIVDSVNKESGPKTIHLYANQSGLSFEQLESIKPIQSITLKGIEMEIVPLKFVNFQKVSFLTVNLKANLDFHTRQHWFTFQYKAKTFGNHWSIKMRAKKEKREKTISKNKEKR